MRLLILLMLLTGCGSEVRDFQQEWFYEEPADPRHIVDAPELWDYVDRFVEETGVRGDSDMIVGFGPLTRPTVGLCQVWSSTRQEYKQITIDPEWWDEASEDSRELLMYHELGHCLMYLDHTDTGIMSPILIDSAEYRDNKEQLINDMKEEL